MIYDGAVVLGGESAATLSKSGLAIHFVNEAFRHGKPLAFISNGSLLLKAAKQLPTASVPDGVIAGDGDAAIEAFVQALHQHRFPRRSIDSVPA
jgi:catalase